MAQNCLARLVKNEDGTRDLHVTVPFDQEHVDDVLDNCSREKKSCTLINGTLASAVSERGSVPFYVDSAFGRLEIRGGVNLWVSRPDSAGKGKSIIAMRDQKALMQTVLEEQAAEDAKWFELPYALVDANGEIVRKQGERVHKELLTENLINDVWFKMPEASA